ERDELLEPGHDLRGHQGRLRIFNATMHDPMPHRYQAMILAMAAQELDQVRDRAVVAEARTLLPPVCADACACRVFRGEHRRGVEPLDLSAQQQVRQWVAISE